MMYMAKSETASVRLTPKNLHDALWQRYPPPDSDLPKMDEQKLLQVVARLQFTDLEGSPIVDRAISDNTLFSLQDDHYAIIAFLDDCFRIAVGQAAFSPAIQTSLRSGMPGLIRAAIVEGLITISKGHGVLDVMDQLTKLAIGWTEKSDKLLTDIKEFIESSMASLTIISESQISTPQVKKSRDKMLADLCSDIAKFSTEEQHRIAVLEERLIVSQTGLIKTNRARNETAQFLNEKMSGKSLSSGVIDFLQGPWYDSLQLLLVQQGTQSDDWSRASKLTETLLWTMESKIPQHDSRAATGHESGTAKVAPANDSISNQGSDADAQDSEDSTHRTSTINQEDTSDIEDRQKLVRIIEHLPEELRDLLVSLEYQDDSKNTALALIESAHLDIITGQAPESSSYEPLPCESGLPGIDADISQSLLSQINKIQPGQWFVVEPMGKPPQQIKLVLKLDDMQHLLFTNRRGIKILQASFDKFAYFLSSEIARPIPSAEHLSSIVRAKLKELVVDFLGQQKSAESAKADQKQSQVSRRSAEVQAVAEENIKTQQEKKKELASRQEFLAAVNEKSHAPENQSALKQAELAVSKLNVGAWVRIPGPEQEPVQCRLAVKLQAPDKYIFANREGMKLGNFSKDQLIDMLVTKECEILDSHSKVEDTLANTVNELRTRGSLTDDNE
jgi:hypothetical protein